MCDWWERTKRLAKKLWYICVHYPSSETERAQTKWNYFKNHAYDYKMKCNVCYNFCHRVQFFFVSLLLLISLRRPIIFTLSLFSSSIFSLMRFVVIAILLRCVSMLCVGFNLSRGIALKPSNVCRFTQHITHHKLKRTNINVMKYKQ